MSTIATITAAPATPAQPDGYISVETFDALKSMFNDFLERSGQLESAYASLQEEVKKVNLELERKNIELRSSLARREALEREVQQAKTMAALGEMSATVAHEIKNPIGAMGVWAGLLERDMDPQDPKRKTLGKITDGLAKLNKIVTNLLVYTRPMTAEFRIVRLDALLEEIVDFTEVEIGRLGRKIAVEKKFDCPDGLCVKADPEKINQAVINLCLNAVQAMEDGGKLSVLLSTSGEYAQFSIVDTGSGISAENITKIFDPFFTTKEDGTGLGLAIVKKIIESHIGTIEVTSERGVGTCVKCCLPIARSD
ncbi:histidine kinase [Fibrobacteres bacterium R8-0-B4]